MRVTIHEAKTNLSRLIKQVEGGDEITIHRGRDPVARLVPIDEPKRRQFGALKGQVALDESFFDPLPDDEIKAWDR